MACGRKIAISAIAKASPEADCRYIVFINTHPSETVAYSCEVDVQRSLGLIKLSGSTDDQDLVAAMRKLYENGEWDPKFNTLWDCTDITELIIGQDGLREIVDVTNQLQPRIGPGKVAFVVRRQIDEMMAKILIQMTKTHERDRRLFHRCSDALEWLLE